MDRIERGEAYQVVVLMHITVSMHLEWYKFSHLAFLQLLQHANYHLAPEFVIIPVNIEQYLLCGYPHHSIILVCKLIFVTHSIVG